MVDRQSKELYQQQLAAHAAWIRRGAAGYQAAAAQHPGFTAPAPTSANAAYENYVLQNMFGGASNILGNSAKDMAGLSSPFRLPGQFPNFPNYQRPLPAHSPLAAHMKNASSATTPNPIAAHMMSNPYQYSANYGLNPSYGGGAMNTNYLHANASATAGQPQNSANYMNQTNDRFRQQFQQNQFSKEQASRQESSRRQSGAVNGGVTPSAEATNAFNLQQLQAAYSQAAINSNAAMLKDASKAKTPPDNYSYYSSATQPVTTTASSTYSGTSSSTDLNDQIAKELLSKFGDRLTPQFLQALQQSASINQSFQQNQLGLHRSESETNSKSKQDGKTEKPAVSQTAQDLRQHDRASAEYLARQLSEKSSRQAEKQAPLKEKAAGNSTITAENSRAMSGLGNMVMQENSLHRSRQQEFTNPYNPISYNAAKAEAAQRMAEYAAQYQQQAANASRMRNDSNPPQSMSHHSRHPSYPLSEDMKSPAVNSPSANQQPSPAHVQSPTNSQLSPAPQHLSPSNHKPSQSPAHTFNNSKQSQAQQQYSPANPQASPANPKQYSPANPQTSSAQQQYSPANPQASPAPQQYSPANPQASPANQQYSPANPQASPANPQQYSPINPQASPAPPPQYSPANPQASPANHQQYSPANPQASPANHQQYSPANPQASPANHQQYSPVNPQASPAPPQQYSSTHSQASPANHQQYSPANPQSSPANQQYSPANPQASPANPKQYSPANTQASPAQQQYSPANPQASPSQQQYSPATSLVSPAPQQYSPANSEVSPAHQQFSPAHSQISPAPQQFSQINSQASPANQQFSPANSQVSPAHQQFSPNPITSASPQISPYSQLSPNLSPYSQPSPKRSPYSQVSSAFPTNQASQSSQHNTQYAPQTSPSGSCLIKQPDTAYSVPSYLRNKEDSKDISSTAEVSDTKPLTSAAPTSKDSLRSSTRSPRLDTPPGLTLPASNEDSLGRHSLPLVTQPLSNRTDNVSTSKPSNSKSVTAPSTISNSTSSSPFFSSNAISGMASMTNKIKLLESKMQNAKSKSTTEKNNEDNSLKNWWKPLSDVQKKSKPSFPIGSKSDIRPCEPEIKSKERGNDFNSERLRVKSPKSPLSSVPPVLSTTGINGKNNLKNDTSPLSPLSIIQETIKMKHSELSKPLDCVRPSDIHKSSSNTSRRPVKSISPSPQPSPVIQQPTNHSTSSYLSQNFVKDKRQKKPSVPQRRPSPEPAPVPYEQPRTQRNVDNYATPNLDRMEIKNSGIPGPSAVTWKRKSIDDAPSNFHQSKKRKMNKSTLDNDVYMFDEEEKSVSLEMSSKEEKTSKGPVYKYKSALISRDYDSDSNHSRTDKSEKSEDDKKEIFKDDTTTSHDRDSPGLIKKKNKRPKLEEWSVARGKSLKSKYEGNNEEKHNSKYDNSDILMHDNSSRKNSVAGLQVVPRPISNERVLSPEVQKTDPGTPEPVQKEGKVAVNKWYQAFGATEVKNKKKQERLDRREYSEPKEKPDKQIKGKEIKEEPEEIKTLSILDIPPEVRRKPRPNFGGLVHFSPDWDRLVKRHHERCKVPEGLDSSRNLKPKILEGQTTPKKNYEDFARKDMVSPPDMLTMERERMEAKAFTDIASPKLPNPDLGELPSILETILENRKKLRQAAKMGGMYQIPFKKEKKRMMRMRMTKTVQESSVTEDNMGLIPTPGLPLINNDNSDVIINSVGFSSFRSYTLGKYLDYGEQGRPMKTSLWTSEVLDSKTRSRTNASLPSVSLKEIFGVEPSPKKVKGKQKEKKDLSVVMEVEAEPKIKKAKLKKIPSVEPETPPSTPKKDSLKEKFVPQIDKEREMDDTFAFSQEIGEPTEDENGLQAELGGFALDLLDTNPSWVNQVTIQNLVVWEPVQPVLLKKKKPKKKRGKKAGWDFPSGKRKSKTSREASRANSPTMEEIHDVEYSIHNVIQESSRWVVDKNAGETNLQRASKMGYPDAVAYAVSMQEMSVKEKDYAGFTPLDKAAFRGHSDVVKILLQFGADPSSGVKGTRALHDAIEGLSRETVRVLLSYGADPLLHNYSGNMPIDLAEGDKHMKQYLFNILADLHGKPPNVRSSPPPVVRWNVSSDPEFHDPRLDPRLVESLEAEAEAKETSNNSDLDDFVFEVSSVPLPTEFQLSDREGEFVLYRELKEFAKKSGYHKGDIKTKCYILELKKSEFLRTSHCRQLDRRELDIKYHEREEEDTIIVVKVDKFVRRILNAERISVQR